MPTPESLSLPAVQRMLRKTTEWLAHELGHPGVQAPDWSETEWRIARAVVAIHGVAGLLARGLRWQGPPGWREFLEQQHTQIAQRLARIQELIREVDSQARTCGIAVVALKGAALHAHGLYAAGERPMADIDLLVAEPDAARAAPMLAQLGFRAGAVTWKHRAFEPLGGAGTTTAFGEDGRNPIRIELHSQIREILPLRAVDLSSLVLPKDSSAGIKDYACPIALLLHTLLHAAGAMIMREARLLHLNDIARLTRGMTAADWNAVFSRAAATADPSLWWAFPPLVLTQRYFHCVPESVLARLSAACTLPLRRAYRQRTLSDVSLSHLWVSAFPGIEWSRSLREMASYAAARVRPGAETLALRKAFAQSQPLVSGGEWAYTSQGRRIVRWLLARQPRQETLTPVRTSLAHPSGGIALEPR